MARLAGATDRAARQRIAAAGHADRFTSPAARGLQRADGPRVAGPARSRYGIVERESGGA
jgi:hypothetical protein